MRRYDELMAKGDLNDDERAELKELNVAIHMAKSRGRRPSRAPAPRPIEGPDNFFARVTLLARFLRSSEG